MKFLGACLVIFGAAAVLVFAEDAADRFVPAVGGAALIVIAGAAYLLGSRRR